MLERIFFITFVKTPDLFAVNQQITEKLSIFFRYIHFPQFGMTAVRIYRQGNVLEDGIKPSDLVESQEGFEERKGEITIDKVFRDIWDVGTKAEPPNKKGKKKKKVCFLSR